MEQFQIFICLTHFSFPKFLCSSFFILVESFLSLYYLSNAALVVVVCTRLLYIPRSVDIYWALIFLSLSSLSPSPTFIRWPSHNQPHSTFFYYYPHRLWNSSSSLFVNTAFGTNMKERKQQQTIHWVLSKKTPHYLTKNRYSTFRSKSCYFCHNVSIPVNSYMFLTQI